MSLPIIATAILFVVSVSCSPIDVSTPATDLLPPEVDNGPTLATDLVPPPLPEDEDDKKVPVTLFLINVYAVKNHTAENTNDVLHDDVIEEVPEDAAEPLAVFLLIVEDEDEGKPVNLDEVAKDLEEEGFVIDKVTKDGQTRLIKVNLDSAETKIKINGDSGNAVDKIEGDAEEIDEKEKDDQPLEEYGKLTKIRRKRTICLHCKLDQLKQKKFGYGGGCGGGCGGGGGGGYYQQPPVYQPVVVVPVQGGGGGYHKKHYGGGGGGYPQQPYYPQQPCNTCGGGGYGQGGGNSYAQASAQASASSSSGGYGY